MPTNSQSLIPNPPARRERDIKRLARNLTQAFAPAGRVLRRTARDPIGAIITALEPPSPKGLRATALLAGEMLPGAGIFDSGQYGRKSAEALKKGDYGISLAEMLTGMGMAATEYPLLKGAKPAIKKAGQWMTDMLRNLSPQQTGELNALVEAGHTTAGALQKIAEQGMEADLTRRQLLRLGGDASKAAAVATHTPRMPEIITSNYPEASARRIVEAVRPILQKASRQDESAFSQDFNKYIGHVYDDWNVSDAEYAIKNSMIDPNYDTKMDNYLINKLRTKEEISEAKQLLEDIPDHLNQMEYFINDGRPKELWRTYMADTDEMPDFSVSRHWKEDGDRVVQDADYKKLSSVYDEGAEGLTDEVSEMGYEAAQDYIEEYEDLANYLGSDEMLQEIAEENAAKYLDVDDAKLLQAPTKKVEVNNALEVDEAKQLLDQGYTISGFDKTVDDWDNHVGAANDLSDYTHFAIDRHQVAAGPKVIVDNTRQPSNANFTAEDRSLVKSLMPDRVPEEVLAQGKPKKISMMEAFGSQEMNDIADIGIKLQEKPGYLSEITTGMSSSQIPDVEKAIGYKLNSYNLADVVKKPDFVAADEIYPQGELIKSALKNDNQMFILWDPETKARYLVDRTGASSYIRNWTKID